MHKFKVIFISLLFFGLLSECQTVKKKTDDIVKKENDHIQIRTFEKGVNRETLSCGSGSTASILAVFLAFEKKYSLVKASGGNLNVDFHFNNKFFEKT